MSLNACRSALLGLLVLAAPLAPADEVKRTVNETLLGSTPAVRDVLAEYFQTSADGRHFSYAVKSAGRIAVFLDSKEIGRFDNLYPGTPVFSPDSQHLAFAALRGTQRIVVVDGVGLGPYGGYGDGSLTFSADSRHLAFSARQSGEWFVVLDGKEGLIHEGVNRELAFSVDNRLAYGALEAGRWFVMVDGAPGKRYEGQGLVAGSLSFSPDGRSFAYAIDTGDGVVAVENGREDRHCAEIGGMAPAKARAVPPQPLVFSPDSKRLAYPCQIGGSYFVVVNGEIEDPYSQILAGTLGFSPDGAHLAYAAAAAGKEFVVRDGKPGPEYKTVGRQLVFSPDSRHFAYAAYSPEGKWSALLDGKETGQYDAIGDMSLKFSADGKHFAYLAFDGGAVYAVVDGTKYGPYSDAFGLTFGPDGRHFSYLAAKGTRAYLVVDGDSGAEINGAIRSTSEIVFDGPDKLHLAIAAIRGNRLDFVVHEETLP